ncbi:hypothetical protein D6827_02185 [Candidatus Parcubacteria bacterium]|nr:MAG: hypothetical protein D6827_02185 [Candidatus Parcubacteria bacterium]
MFLLQKNYFKYFLLPLAVVILAVVSIFVWQSRAPQASAGLSDNLGGHAWDTYYGWISYNSCNSAYTNPPYPAVDNCWSLADWGLNATFTTGTGGEITGGEVSGFMWHDALGWICVGSTCASYTGVNECGSDITPPSGNLAVTFDTQDALQPEWWELKGWGKICAWGDDPDAAWISFNCSNTGDCATSDYKVYINVDDYTLGDPNNGLGSCPGSISECGFAWNGYTVGGQNYGTGFIMFDPSNSVAHVVHFVTTEGDVYAYRDINPSVDSGSNNATYLILSETGTIANFNSEERYKTISESYLQSSPDLLTDPAKVPTPVASGVKLYANALSYLDVQGIIDGDYGTVNSLPASWGTQSLTLNGEVYHRAGDFTINSGSTVTFNVGSGSVSGAGTFVIEGDLIIRGNIRYQQTGLSDIDNLPVAVFIVLGDVVIDPAVTDIAGNFIVLGDGVTTCPSSLADDPQNCGRFSTGVSSSDTLTIRGMVMAKQFNFQRMYTDVLNTPAEVINYDGRLIANTPPGLEEITDTLPIFKKTSPF